jgi:heme-degrading monooxygenase HmoA
MEEDRKPIYAVAVSLEIPADRQSALATELRSHLGGWISRHPGFIRATLNVSIDEHYVFVYILWDSKDAAVNFRTRPDSDRLWQVIHASGARQRYSHVYEVIEFARDPAP